MRDPFEKALKDTLVFEGGYANVRADSGGETFRGVSRRSNPNWAGWPLIETAKAKVGVKRLRPFWTTIDEYFKDDANMFTMVADVYRAKYWPPVVKLQAPARATAKVFDTGVNIGPSQAIKFTQAIIGTAADGVVGPKTLAEVEKYFSQPGAEGKFLRAYCKVQEKYYRDIVARKPDQAKFLETWLKRAAWVPAG